MVRRFTDSGVEGAEWSVGHMGLGFRICTYNHEHKDGPVHVHDRFNRVAGVLPAMTKAQAYTIARMYVERHDWFDMESLTAATEEVLHGDPH